jgi:hypothetical protein
MATCNPQEQDGSDGEDAENAAQQPSTGKVAEAFQSFADQDR